MWAPISSTNTRRPGSRPPISTRHPRLKNSSRSAAPLELFSAPRETSYRPAHRGFTHPHPHDGEQELGPLSVGGPRPLLQVFREQLPRLPVQLGGLAGGLPRFQGAALVELLAVTLDRCPVNAETAGGLALGDALLHRLDDLLSEVHRVRSHAPVLPGAASSHSAVDLERVAFAGRELLDLAVRADLDRTFDAVCLRGDRQLSPFELDLQRRPAEAHRER